MKKKKRPVLELLLELFLSLPIDFLVSIFKFEKKISRFFDALSDYFIEHLKSFGDNEKKRSILYRLLIIIIFLLILAAILLPIIINLKIIIMTLSLPLLCAALFVWLMSLYVKYKEK